MFYFIKIAFLGALIKILIQTRNPRICAAIYASIYFILSFLFMDEFSFAIFIAVAIVFGLSYVYYWFLNKFYDTSMISFWIVLLTGALIGFI